MVADFRRTLELKPDFWQAWINWGCPLIEGYNEVMALQTWQQGLTQLTDNTPDYPEACARLYHYQGKAYSRQGQQQHNSHSKNCSSKPPTQSKNANSNLNLPISTPSDPKIRFTPMGILSMCLTLIPRY